MTPAEKMSAQAANDRRAKREEASRALDMLGRLARERVVYRDDGDDETAGDRSAVELDAIEQAVATVREAML